MYEVTHLHQVPMLRMSGAILLLPLYAFMARTGITLNFFCSPYLFVTLFADELQ